MPKKKKKWHPKTEQTTRFKRKINLKYIKPQRKSDCVEERRVRSNRWVARWIFIIHKPKPPQAGVTTLFFFLFFPLKMP